MIGLASLAETQQSGRAAEIQESLQSRYRLTRIGPRALGIGGNENSVRHAGGVVVLRKEGLYGSFKRNQLISMSIIGGKVDVLSGSKESSIPLAVGERFYVVAVSVSSDAVTLGLLSTETASSGGQSGQLWASLNFFFAKELIQRGDVSHIYPKIDEWLLPEGAGAAPSAATPAPVPTPAMPTTKNAVPGTDTVVIDLHNGMTREEIIAAMGKPEREVTYADRRWMRYAEVTAVLEKGKVIAIENNPGRSSLKVTSEPPGADFYLDGALAGSTPSTIGIPAGQHTIIIKRAGFQDWQRELSVLAGSEINLNATLSK
jgi:hypothetical protein